MSFSIRDNFKGFIFGHNVFKLLPKIGTRSGFIFRGNFGKIGGKIGKRGKGGGKIGNSGGIIGNSGGTIGKIGGGKRDNFGINGGNSKGGDKIDLF